jgi:hypothetical protein
MSIEFSHALLIHSFAQSVGKFNFVRLDTAYLSGYEASDELHCINACEIREMHT